MQDMRKAARLSEEIRNMQNMLPHACQRRADTGRRKGELVNNQE